ncbi:MAG: hypothetical protein HOY79_22595 [Streptomyces sp.]|nr:hypothetical protein [Streptomyces sp.]
MRGVPVRPGSLPSSAGVRRRGWAGAGVVSGSGSGSAYVLTRPLGASLGDCFSPPTGGGGVGLGAVGTSALFLTVVLGLVVYLAVTRRDVTEQERSARRVAWPVLTGIQETFRLRLPGSDTTVADGGRFIAQGARPVAGRAPCRPTGQETLTWRNQRSSPTTSMWRARRVRPSR